jgi:hypothetical protein
VVTKATPDRSGSKCLPEYQQRKAILPVRSSELKYSPQDAHMQSSQNSATPGPAKPLSSGSILAVRKARKFEGVTREQGLLNFTQHSSLRMGGRYEAVE